KLYERLVEQRGLQEGVDEMRKYLIVANHGGNTFRISYDAESRDLAKNVLDKLLKGMLEEDAQKREREVTEAKKFLDTERTRAGSDPVTGTPSESSAEAARARAHAELAAAQKDLLERQTRFTNEHPDVKQAVRRVASAEAAVRKADAAAAPAAGATPASAAAP